MASVVSTTLLLVLTLLGASTAQVAIGPWTTGNATSFGTAAVRPGCRHTASFIQFNAMLTIPVVQVAVSKLTTLRLGTPPPRPRHAKCSPMGATFPRLLAVEAVRTSTSRHVRLRRHRDGRFPRLERRICQSTQSCHQMRRLCRDEMHCQGEGIASRHLRAAGSRLPVNYSLHYASMRYRSAQRGAADVSLAIIARS